MNRVEALCVRGKEYVTTLFVWENLTSVSERYIFTKCRIFPDIFIFSYLCF